MSSARYARIMQDCWSANDIHGARNAYREYQIAHCYHPQRISIIDSHIQTERVINVACGKCYHCLESKINEWCTRMYAHAEDFKNVYFVTLTYRSFTNVNLPINRLLLNKLSGAVWHYDNFNYYHHLSYNPCVLCKDHYQKFLKRLRKNTGLTDLTYVLSGEYGSTYGRPHFHMVLFTNGTLTRADIVRAWSVALWKNIDGDWMYKTSQMNNGQAYYFPIGNVDFNDLVRNGSFNTTAKIKVDGAYMNAANCFAYVCKYVVKRDEANLNRVRIAFNNLFVKKKYISIGDDDIPYEELRIYCKLFNIKYNYKNVSRIKSNSYEKRVFQPSQSVYEYGLCHKRFVQKKYYSYYEEVFPEMYYDFRKVFRPFCEFSRGTPIGSVYAARNISEFEKGVFTKPLLQESGFVVPNYFRNKAQEHLYGLREVRKTISGQSFALGGLVDLYGRFQSDYFSYISSLHLNYSVFDTSDIKACLSCDLYKYFDKATGEYIIFRDGFACHYKFDKHKKTYDNTRNIPIADFIRYWTSSLIDEFKRHDVAIKRSKQNMRLQERAQLLMTDLGDAPEQALERFLVQSEQERREQQKKYNAVHKSVE